jgi:hypothetical protein
MVSVPIRRRLALIERTLDKSPHVSTKPTPTNE